MRSKELETTLFLREIPETPLGPIQIAMHGATGSEVGSSQGATLVAVEIGSTREDFAAGLSQRFHCQVASNVELTDPAALQIQEYLSGQRQKFDLSVDLVALSPFHKRVLQAIAAIPYGQVRTYGELAFQLGNPRAARAVGRASATNPVPLVIPCHRLLGADGSLRGYRAPDGIRTKAWLLELEGVMLPGLAGAG